MLLTGLLWWSHARALGDLRDSVRVLSSEVASLRKSPVIDVAGAPAVGPRDAVVTLVEFSDYECPFCIRHFTQTMPRLHEAFIASGRIRYVFRDFPIAELHPGAGRAHEAGQCAAEQGKFWDLHGRLFSPPGSHGDEALVAQATSAGLAVEPFRTCLASGRTTRAIQQLGQVAADLGATGTPSFFIGLRDRATDQVRVLQAITGAQPFDVFQKAIEAAELRSSGAQEQPRSGGPLPSS